VSDALRRDHRQAPEGELWRRLALITTLPREPAARAMRVRLATGAADYDELIDHPVEWANSPGALRGRGVPHDIAITGHHDCDLERLSKDLERICEGADPAVRTKRTAQGAVRASCS
jgi:predicted metalloprotease with PDZ domain